MDPILRRPIARWEPKPVQDPHPPIWIGQDTSARTLDVVAETADAVNMHAESPGHADRKMDRVERTCNEIGPDRGVDH